MAWLIQHAVTTDPQPCSLGKQNTLAHLLPKLPSHPKNSTWWFPILSPPPSMYSTDQPQRHPGGALTPLAPENQFNFDGGAGCHLGRTKCCQKIYVQVFQDLKVMVLSFVMMSSCQTSLLHRYTGLFSTQGLVAIDVPSIDVSCTHHFQVQQWQLPVIPSSTGIYDAGYAKSWACGKSCHVFEPISTTYYNILQELWPDTIFWPCCFCCP